MFAKVIQRRWYPPLQRLLLLPLLVLSSDSVATNKYYNICSEHSHCGNLSVTYPFRLSQSPVYCGYPGYELACSGDERALTIVNGAEEYYVKSINYEEGFFIVIASEFMENSCPQSFTNTSFSPALFNYAKSDLNLTVYLDCSFPKLPPDLKAIACLHNSTFGIPNGFYKVDQGPSTFFENFPGGCNLTAAIPVYGPSDNGNADWFQLALKEGFGLTWNHRAEWCRGCMNSGGICGHNETLAVGQICFCPNTTGLGTCSYNAGKGSAIWKVVIGLTAALVCFLLACIPLCFCICHRSRLNTFIFWKKDKIALTIEAFLDTCDYLGPKRYSYSALKKITNSFSEKLGQGGFGTVFKGELPGGHFVAVKILTDATGNGDEFVNEVASIGRTSHVNVVSLLGFSSDGSKRALIYEFMSNGSLEKYIYSESLKSTLGWEKLFQIAVGIARGLEYLHRGCKTHIVHFDIKPHNILLDQDFCPKISDFGLAKLCLRKDSIFSAIDTRGTIGYIAPEVFSRNFGVVSSKSDVYSYGMMVLEMVGGRKRSHSGANSSSESYFPHWIYENFHQIGNIEGINVSDQTEEIAKKMILIGLWCIQTKPVSRPSMSKVVDMLGSSIDDLEMPQKPYLSSP